MHTVVCFKSCARCKFHPQLQLPWLAEAFCYEPHYSCANTMEIALGGLLSRYGHYLSPWIGLLEFCTALQFPWG